MKNAESLRKAWVAALHKFTQLRHWLVGTDPALLAQCAKNVQTFYAALAMLMLTAAALTASNLAPRLAAMWGLGWVGTTLAWCGTFIAVTCLEAAMMNSISRKTSTLRVLLIRLPMAGVLALMQAVPNVVGSFEPEIELHRHEQAAEFQLKNHDAQKKLLGVEELTRYATEAQANKDKAGQDVVNPPRDAAVDAANTQLLAKQGLETKARNRLAHLERKLGTAQAQLRKAGAKADDQLRAGVDAAREAVNLQRSNLATAEVDLRKAEIDVRNAQQAQNARLGEALADATQLVTTQSAVLQTANTQLTERDLHTRRLTEALHRPDLLAQLNALLEVAKRQPTVMFQLVLIFMVYLALDIAAIALKVLFKDNEYAQKLDAQLQVEAIDRENSISEAQAALHAQEAARVQHKALLDNQTLGVRNWTEFNKGLLAEKLTELDAELRLQEASALQGIAVTETAVKRLGQLLEHLIQHQRLVEAHPEIADVYAQQLQQLVAEIQARVTRLCSRPAGGATTT